MPTHQRIIDKTIWKPAAGNPVLRRGPEGSWDSSAVLDPCIAAVDGGYAMWYGGRLQTVDPEGKRVHAQVGHALSPDGIRWEKQGFPVLSPGTVGAWDSAHVYNPFVIDADGGFRMYYHGDDAHPGRSEIGLALSEDGLLWKRYEGNPVLRRGGPGNPDDHLVCVPNVLPGPGEDGFAMVYSQVAKRDGRDYWTIALAESDDGVDWKKLGAILSLESEGWNVSSPTIIRLEGKYYLWVWVFDHDRMQDNHVRLYSSGDLREWEPVWETGWANPWADNEVSRLFFMPRIFRIADERLLLFYPIRYDRGYCDVGLATADL